jgi:DnaK suppressor protein
MNPEKLDHYRLNLEEQLAQLTAATDDHESRLDESHTTTDFVGADRAAELESFEVDTSITASEHRLAAKIHHALERISKGTYGLCEACGTDIPTTRLDAKPSVSLCLACQEAHELDA